MAGDEREDPLPPPADADAEGRGAPSSLRGSNEDEAPGEPGLRAPSAPHVEAEAPRKVPDLSPGEPAAAPSDAPPAVAPAPRPRRRWREALAEPPEAPIEVPRSRLAAQSRRDFLLYAAGVAASAASAWWLFPDRTKARLLPGPARDRLDTLAARAGLTRERRERA